MGARGAGTGIGTGVAYSVGAYFIWGLLPLWFHLLRKASPLEVVACRTLFALPVALAMAAALGQLGLIRSVLVNRRVLAPLCLSAGLILVNWTVYVIAVQQGHALAASLGYYINPLLNVLLGTVFLGERLSGRQWAAVTLAGTAVALLAWGARDMVWIGVGLAGSFSFYALVRKLVPVAPLPGLAVETIVLAPVALGYMAWAGSGDHLALGGEWRLSLLLASSGIITAFPLFLFAEAARRLDFSTLGFIQYISPTLVFLISVFILHEPLRPLQLGCFALIWAGVGLYVWDLAAQHRARGRAG